MKQLFVILTGLLLLNGTASKAQVPSLSLSEAMVKALESNYGIQISIAGTEVAGLNNDWGMAGRYPEIGFDASLISSYDPSDKSMNSRISAGIGVNWILFDGYRVNITKMVLENRESLSEGQLGIVVETTIEEVILAYYSVLLERERLNVMKNVMELSRDRYDYEQKKRALGSAVTYEVLQAETVFLSDKAAFLEQEVRVRSAIRNLNFILAEDPAMVWDFTERFEADTTHFKLSDLQARMSGDNQLIKNQYTNLLITQEQTKLRKSEFYPSINASAGIDNSYTATRISGSPGQNNNSLAPYGGLSLSWDIYRGGVRKRNMEIARINEEIAAVELDEMQHSLTNELHNLYDYHEVRIALLRVAEKGLEAAELNLQLSGEKYRSGAINSFNYRDVQLGYLDASLRKLQAIYNLVDSNTRLTRITGGFLSYTP